jgi:hypothetical protein
LSLKLVKSRTVALSFVSHSVNKRHSTTTNGDELLLVMFQLMCLSCVGKVELGVEM